LKIITLGYHDIVDAGSASERGQRVAPSRYTLGRVAFRQHLESIRDARVRLTTVGGSEEPNPVLVTFDDGALGSYTCAAEELERLGWRGHFFITTDWIGREGFMNRDQIRDLRRRGHVIGSHTRSHPARMSRLPWDELIRQWTESRAILADLLGEAVSTASVSDGYYSSTVGRSAAASGLQFLFNSEPTPLAQVVDGCSVLGRYSILSNTAAQEAAALARGTLASHVRQAVSWNAKKIVKAVAGESYLTLRRMLLSDGK
jgi:peptidoglycan/xylan/chitin deacetylase (PgdA/CDA1 family)